MFGNHQETRASSSTNSEKEWRLIERVVLANTQELKKQRRWGIFFKLLTFTYLIGIFAFFAFNTSTSELGPTGGHVAVIDVQGLIADGELAGADVVVSSLNRALNHSDTKAVILRINSGGGSPVQSAYIFNEILRLREIHASTPIYSVISDTGASGAYYIAAATEEIFANGASLVGSIGVTAASFGYQELLEKIGVERRQFTSGEHKSFLDPFVAVDEEERLLFETLLADVHEQFINDVKRGRGDRLSDEPKLFSGLVWSGRQALDLGLIDGLKSTGELARELGYPTADFSYQLTPFEQFTRNLGVAVAEAALKIGAEQSLELR